MRRFAVLVVAVVLCAPAGAQPAATLTLEPEQAVTIALSAEGRPGAAVVARGRAMWSAFDLAVARNFVAGAYDAAIGDNAMDTRAGQGIPDPPPITPDGVRIRFMHIAGRHSQLILENGYDQALLYRARIAVSGRMRPTDVCVVAPNNRSTEHWPEAIERITLYELRLIPWQAGRRVTCE